MIGRYQGGGHRRDVLVLCARSCAGLPDAEKRGTGARGLCYTYYETDNDGNDIVCRKRTASSKCLNYVFGEGVIRKVIGSVFGASKVKRKCSEIMHSPQWVASNGHGMSALALRQPDVAGSVEEGFADPATVDTADVRPRRAARAAPRAALAALAAAPSSHRRRARSRSRSK